MQHRHLVAATPRLAVILALLAGLAASVIACDPIESCKTTVFEEVPAPGGAIKAVVFERDCGATSGFNTTVAIYLIDDSADTLIEKSVFSAPRIGSGAGVTVSWLSNENLLIDNSDAPRPRIAEREAEGPGGRVITVEYSKVWRPGE